MYMELLPVFLALAAGQFWRVLRPGGVTAGELARTLNYLMIYLTGPALILAVLAPAPLDQSSWVLPAAGVVCALGGLTLAAVFYGVLGRIRTLSRESRGAMLLAASFANGSIALPVVVALFGPGGIQTVYLYDLLSTTVLIWTLGAIVAARHSPEPAPAAALGLQVLRLPPVWVLAIALTLNLAGVGLPAPVLKSLRFIGEASIPLMVMTVGLSLELSALRRIGWVMPALLVRQVLGPALGLALAWRAGLRGETLAVLGVTMASACPAVGIILAHRFKLDTALYGAALSLSILSYLALAPLYQALLSR